MSRFGSTAIYFNHRFHDMTIGAINSTERRIDFTHFHDVVPVGDKSQWEQENDKFARVAKVARAWSKRIK